jgi:hypothetical protein
MDMAWALLLASGLGTFALGGGLVFRRARVLRADLEESRRALEGLSVTVAGLEQELARQRSEIAVREEPAYVITDLGTPTAELELAVPRVRIRPSLPEQLSRGIEVTLAGFLARPSEGPKVARRIVDRSAVKIVALGFGVARALRPEARDRIEFASRTEMRRSRRRREYELKLARRLVRSGQVQLPQDPS